MRAMPEAATSTPALSTLLKQGLEIEFVSHAAAILAGDFPHASAEIEKALSGLELPITEIIGSGGGETKFTQRLRRTLTAMDWPKHIFEITKTVDGVPKQSTSHEIDHVRRSDKGVIALGIEWNNKDPFFDRDLENKYGTATTHWDKLMDRVRRGVGNPCPLLLIGLPAAMIRFDTAKIEVLEDSNISEADAVPSTTKSSPTA